MGVRVRWRSLMGVLGAVVGSWKPIPAHRTLVVTAHRCPGALCTPGWARTDRADSSGGWLCRKRFADRDLRQSFAVSGLHERMRGRFEAL